MEINSDAFEAEYIIFRHTLYHARRIYRGEHLQYRKIQTKSAVNFNVDKKFRTYNSIIITNVYKYLAN